MPVSNIELRHLRYFVAVAEHETMSGAAKRLHISQPPLSRQIRDLEFEVGVALFERDSRRLKLTSSGELFLKEARAILQQFDNAVVLAREMANRNHGKIRVGHSSVSSIEALPRILRFFQDLFPEAKLELRRLPTQVMISALKRGELDVCLTVGGAATDLADFKVEHLSCYGLLGAVPRQHPFARIEKIPLREFAHEPVLSLKRSAFPWYNEYVAGLLTAFNPRFEVAEEHDGTEGVVAAVEAGRGVALVYDVMSRTLGERLVLRELTPTPPEAPLVLFYRNDSQPPLITGFVRAARTLK